MGARRPHPRLRRLAYRRAARLVRRPPPRARPSLTSVLGTGLALVGVLVTYGAWRHTTAPAARASPPARSSPPTPTPNPRSSRPRRSPPTSRVYGDIAAAPDPADPGRLLLGPLHRHAADGFHLDALYAALFVRPVQAAARLVRFLDREVVDTYVRGAGGLPRLLGAAVRRAQTGNVQTYLERAARRHRRPGVAAVLVATGALSSRDRYQRSP